MRIKTRITALVIALFCFSNMLVFASPVRDGLSAEMQEEVDYMGDVYKYDMSLTEDVEADAPVVEEAEVFNYYKADKIALTLGLMKLKEGKFREETILSAEDFALIAKGLNLPEGDYASVEAVTHEAALGMLVRALGFDLDDDAGFLRFVSNNDLIDGITYNAVKHISRGEMAQLVYNALSADLLKLESIGANTHYEQQSGETLLGKVFELTEISGIVTAANGMNIYANKKMDDEEIEIDRLTYRLGDGVTAAGLIGHSVFALADISDGSRNELVMLEADPYDKAVEVTFDDVLSFNGKKLTYMDGDKEKTYSVSTPEYILLNGESKIDLKFTEDIFEGEGTLTLNSDSETSFAIVNKYTTLVADRVSMLSDKIYFRDKLLLDGKDYVSIAEDELTMIIRKNGVEVSASDLVSGDILNIMYVPGKFLAIEASDASVEGKIEAIKDGNLIIDGQEYYITPSYNAAIKNGADLPSPDIGLESEFLLTHLGSVAYVSSFSRGYQYGVLGNFGISGGLEKNMGFRIFTQKSEWSNFSMADKAVVDGVSMTKDEAFAYLDGIRSVIKYNPVRFRVVGEELRGIDTVNMLPEEAGDVDALIESHRWGPAFDPVKYPFTTDWRKGLNLRNSTYSVTDDAKIFYIPDDVDDEEEYKFYRQSDIPADSTVNLILYNADEYFTSDIAVYTGTSQGGTFVNTQNFIVTGVSDAVDKNDNLIYVLEGNQSSINEGNKGYNKTKYTTTANIRKNNTIAAGDLIHINLDSNGNVYQMDKLMSVSDLNNSEFCEQIGYDERTFGTVVSADPSRDLLKVTCEGVPYSYYIRAIGIYDVKKKTATTATLDDVQPGDKVYFRGGYRMVLAMIYRQ